MTTCTRPTAVLATAAALAVLVLACMQAPAASALSPLPPSSYSTRAVCPPPAPGHASCLAQALVAQTAQARAYDHPVGVSSAAPSAAPSPAAGDFGLRPSDLHSAYQLPTNASGAQTIALVDVYNDLSAEEDLGTYDTEFGLPACTTANGCFAKLNQNGEATPLPFPETQTSLSNEQAVCAGSGAGHVAACELVEEAEGWSVEISLDIETAHATCQSCHIALVEANSSHYADLEAAEGAAERLPANEVSNSWGGPECEEGLGCIGASSVFTDPRVVITASAGDDGFDNWLEEPQTPYANFPASSPHVVAVGGTRLYLGTHGEWAGETVWNDGGESEGLKDGHGAGGGCSVQFAAPTWQQSVSDWSSVGCAGKRAVADVSADADPYTGLAVYDTSPECETSYTEGGKKHTVHWCTIGGTSLASPLVASVFALAGGAQGVEFPARTLYQNAAKSPGSLHDVREGSNGACLSPFVEAEEEEPHTACEPAQEAATSCSSHLVCLAAPGYDGPTGVGTPDGLTAFQPSAEGSEEDSSGISGGSGGGGGGEAPPSSGPTAGGAGASPATTGSPGALVAPSVQISALQLTLRALVALNTSRPKVAQVGFTFLSSAAARVLASLQRKVVKRGRTHWAAAAHALALAASSGRNSGRLAGRRSLAVGTYRLTLTPAHGAARSIVFRIG
ncbi:MAG TPA: S53 family peptidase [Solirubrobacteraceae bacterium]|jgi:hypothetical protein|nr:S53 family peptidase [Solirubrobacteraceae bacterium]